MHPSMQHVQSQLLDLGAGRIRAMDEGGVDLQVLSLAAIGGDTLSASDQTAVFRGVHDELASAIQAHPDRLKHSALPLSKSQPTPFANWNARSGCPALSACCSTDDQRQIHR